MAVRHKAVFCDKDGTIIPDVPYNVNPRLVSLFDGVGSGLKNLKDQGYKIFVVSNQSGVSRGIFRESHLEAVSSRLQQLLGEYGVSVDGFYYCPHSPTDGCNCRKPLSGLLTRAAAENSIELRRSWMVGDILNDVEAGNRAGCRTVLIHNGNESEWLRGELREPDFIAGSFSEAATHIVNTETKEGRAGDKKLFFDYQEV